MFDLFEDHIDNKTESHSFAEGAHFLSNFAQDISALLFKDIQKVINIAPFIGMKTPGGRDLSITTTSCGHYGWVSDQFGYRYSTINPSTRSPWPPMPKSFSNIAINAAHTAGYDYFSPNSCLINRYQPGDKLSLHQDKDEDDFKQPIVSVSLGLPAVFQFGGLERSDPVIRMRLTHGDVVVWGGKSRLCFHGVEPIRYGAHSLLGPQRINLTFRCPQPSNF